MSNIREIILIASIVFCVPGIVSGINEKTFVDEKYHRICYTDGYGTPTDACRKIAQKSNMSSGVYADANNITGECKEIGVNLEDAYGNPTRINFEIVFCDLGPNYNACVSASTNDGVLEYFKYLPNRHNYYRCIHQGSCNL